MQSKINEASRALLSLAASGAGAQQIVEAAYAWLKKPIALVDEMFRVLAFYGPGVRPEDCRRRMDGDPEIRLAWRRQVGASRGPVIDEQGSGVYRAMCMDVRYRDIAVAKLTFMETSPFTEEDREMMVLLSEVLALQQAGSGIPLTTTQDQERSALLRCLIHGEQPAQDLKTLLRYLSIPENVPVRLLVFEIGKPEKSWAPFYQQLKSLFGLIFLEEQGLALCMTGASEYEAALPEILSMVKKLELYCGVSRTFSCLEEVRDYYGQALAALRVAKTGENGTLRAYEDCFAEDLISLCRKERNLKTFIRPEILRLQEYDRENKTDYLNTLACYLESLCNMADTARKTFLHYNTIKYRLKQIQEITGIGEITANDLCEYLFSIRAMNRKSGES